jgi:hypothetical protein
MIVLMIVQFAAGLSFLLLLEEFFGVIRGGELAYGRNGL